MACPVLAQVQIGGKTGEGGGKVKDLKQLSVSKGAGWLAGRSVYSLYSLWYRAAHGMGVCACLACSLSRPRVVFSAVLLGGFLCCPALAPWAPNPDDSKDRHGSILVGNDVAAFLWGSARGRQPITPRECMLRCARCAMQGGERSFTTVAFTLALGAQTGMPFR
jgi:hypothetical protein